MTLYVHVSNGLRGCYMPDNSSIMEFATRKELKSFLVSESDDMRDAYGYGGTKQEIASVAAFAWKNRKKGWNYDIAIGFGRSRAANDRPFGLFLGHATRHEFAEYLKNENF